ncbi:type II toxin-antitoxin system HicA family toxin [Synechocystis sp. CACIAM 05]|jgi:predicted RNA binding protein YcfA (HicA-like mRNA interferase family)|uniref:type II toxin-antitoxin system HicA family toxin n=1 Tax=Synechocystis sp. CACIAM 05 TaxID=1933929 RepID=UPI00138E8EB4|nr:type II toxin-antitoxin system HicA family toxin [Synechocystis sp. CACIAM 05]QHV01156.1 hypothetical protein BWK47_14115 [Synechocystis sp. CACIAM 05]
MKLPRDLSGKDLAKKLKRFGYEVSHQTGSHIRLTTQHNGEHHLTIPAHSPLKIGTLNSILRNISEHFVISREEILKQIF